MRLWTLHQTLRKLLLPATAWVWVCRIRYSAVSLKNKNALVTQVYQTPNWAEKFFRCKVFIVPKLTPLALADETFSPCLLWILCPSSCSPLRGRACSADLKEKPHLSFSAVPLKAWPSSLSPSAVALNRAFCRISQLAELPRELLPLFCPWISPSSLRKCWFCPI